MSEDKKTDPKTTKQTKQEVEEEARKQGVPNDTIAATVAAVLEAIDKRDKGKGDDTITPFSLDKDDYPDPTPDLYKVPELKRFALKENYKLTWKVEMIRYETRDGKWHQEPRFIVELWKKPTEEQLAESEEKGGSLTADMFFLLSTHIQTEQDPGDTRELADKMGLKVKEDFDDFDQLMERLRFERIKRWLVDTVIKKKPTEEVVNAPKELAMAGTIRRVHKLGDGGVMVESEKIIK